MNVLARYHVAGGGAREIAASVEAAVRAGRLVPGDSLPTVRDLAGELGVSPGTGAAAYAELRRRGLVVTAGRRGTRVRGRPPLPAHPVTPSRAGISDLGAGAPDPELLPALGPVLARLAPPARLYGEAPNLPELVELARGQLDRDGVPPGPVAVVSGALDGIERVLVAHTRPGDRVAVEDPGYPPVFDLLATLGLTPEPVRLDRAGPARGALRRALEARAVALVVTPRAQNPTGATLGAERAAELAEVLDRYPDVLVVEDDHAGQVAGAPYRTLAAGRRRWAVVRSVSKTLGPDLRLAVLCGDQDTVSRVEDRQLLGPGWVSHPLLAALAGHGIDAVGDSGLNVWVPVPEEARAAAALLDGGWAVAAGERYRLRSPTAVRVTVATLREPAEAERLAATLARALAPPRRTHPAGAGALRTVLRLPYLGLPNFATGGRNWATWPRHRRRAWP